MHVLAAGPGAGGTIGIIFGVVFVIAAYWAPTIVAWTRHVPNAGSVTVINALLGWTLVGWAIALAMACRSHLPQVTVTIGGQSPYPPQGELAPRPEPWSPQAPQPERKLEGYR